MRYERELAGRVQVWRAATSAAQQMADEFAQWLDKPASLDVQPL